LARICLIRPPAISSSHAYSVGIVPPLGPAYIAGSLEAAGHLVSAVDALGEAPDMRRPAAWPGLVAYGLSIPEIVERIPADTEGIGFSVMFSQQWPHVEAIVKAVHARFPKAAIFIGGEHATAAWTYLINQVPEIALCVLGEGEQTALEVAEWMDGKRALETIEGIAYRGPNGATLTSKRARLKAPEKLPRPAWHLFPLEAYLSRGYGHGVNRGRSIPILATRGCPFQCTFCSSPGMWTTRYVVRPVEDVVDEIASHVAQYQVTNVDFEDLTAIIKRDWILRFCDELDRRGLKITYQLPSGTRSEALDRDVLQALYRTGCRNITYAPESGSERTLDRIKKRVHLDRMLDSMRAAHEIGMVIKMNMIIGFPFETRRDIWDTIRFSLRLAWLGIDDIPLFPYCPYPGSELYEELRRDGTLPEMSNDYFASLGYMDVTQNDAFCKEVGAREIGLYRTLGMGLLVMIAYSRYPWRVLRTVRNLWRGTSDSVVEQRLGEMIRRPALKPGAAAPALPATRLPVVESRPLNP
jgi:radical SAM superfamily enzyme YgiQ (UPF0313 family)